MSTKILLKKSVTSGSAPLTSDIDTGEIALNLADRKIYTKNNGGSVITLGVYVDAVAPANPAEGDLWYDTANNLLKSHNGSTFASAGYTTVGALEDVTLTSIASGDHLTWNGTAFVNSNFETDAEALFTAANTGTGHGDLSYANGVYTFDRVTAAEIRGEVSVTDAGGDGSLSYDSATGVVTYTGPSAAETQAHFSAAHTASTFGDLTYLNGVYTHTGVTQEEIEDVVAGQLVTNGSHTNITATYDDAGDGAIDLSIADTVITGKISVTDAGGDGSLGYDSATGVITYTGPSAAEVRAHVSGGTGVTYTAGTGVIEIGQPVATTDNVTFAKVTTSLIEGGSTITIDPAGTGDNTGDVIIAGSLTVQGTTTSVNSTQVDIGDSIILLNALETGTPSSSAGFEVERGTAANKSFLWNEAAGKWDLANEELHNVVLDGGTY